MLERDHGDLSEVERTILCTGWNDNGKFDLLAMCLLDEMEGVHGIDSWQAATCREIFRAIKSRNDWREAKYDAGDQCTALRRRNRELCAQIRTLGGKVK